MKPMDAYLAGMMAGVLMVYPGARAAEPAGNLDQTFAVNPGGRLVIQADRGAISATTDAGTVVRVRVFREAKGGSAAKRAELLANHEVTFEQAANTLTVTAREKKARSWSFGVNQPWLEVRYEVILPKQFNADFRTAGGEVRLTDLEGEASARTTSGDIRFGKITGRVVAADAGGGIYLAEAGGDLLAHTTSGEIKVLKAGGKVEISDAGGDIYLREAAGDVKAGTTSGKIVIESAKGAVEANDAGGNIRIEAVDKNLNARTTSGSIYVGVARGDRVKLGDAGGDLEVLRAEGSVAANTTSGTIKVRYVRGKLEARDAGGDIIIDEAAADVSAQTMSGSVKIKRVGGNLEVGDAGGDIRVEEVGGNATVHTTSGVIALGVVQGKVDAHGAGTEITVAQVRDVVTAHTTGGSVRVAFAGEPKAGSRVEVLGGGIEVSLPRSAAFDLEAHSTGGTVKSDLPVSVTTSGHSPFGELKGAINGGGPLLRLRASSGDIRVKASAAVAPVSSPTPMKAEDDERAPGGTAK